MKQRIAEFPTQQEPYLYQLQSDGSAVVFIRKLIREEHRQIEEESEEVIFVYNENEFIVDSKEITEEMIKANPMNYLNYPPKKIEISLEQRVSDLEAMWLEELLGGDEE